MKNILIILLLIMIFCLFLENKTMSREIKRLQETVDRQASAIEMLEKNQNHLR